MPFKNESEYTHTYSKLSFVKSTKAILGEKDFVQNNGAGTTVQAEAQNLKLELNLIFY